MSNLGDELFTYDTFQQAYDSDPKIQNIVADFNKNSVKIKAASLHAIRASSNKILEVNVFV